MYWRIRTRLPSRRGRETLGNVMEQVGLHRLAPLTCLENISLEHLSIHLRFRNSSERMKAWLSGKADPKNANVMCYAPTFQLVPFPMHIALH